MHESLSARRTFWIGRIMFAHRGKNWCYLKDVYMAMCMTVCIIVYRLC
jgi:hypothetical protein